MLQNIHPSFFFKLFQLPGDSSVLLTRVARNTLFQQEPGVPVDMWCIQYLPGYVFSWYSRSLVQLMVALAAAGVLGCEWVSDAELMDGSAELSCPSHSLHQDTAHSMVVIKEKEVVASRTALLVACWVALLRKAVM